MILDIVDFPPGIVDLWQQANMFHSGTYSNKKGLSPESKVSL